MKTLFSEFPCDTLPGFDLHFNSSEGCFHVSETPQSFYVAKETCAANNMTLASMVSQVNLLWRRGVGDLENGKKHCVSWSLKEGFLSKRLKCFFWSDEGLTSQILFKPKLIKGVRKLV